MSKLHIGRFLKKNNKKNWTIAKTTSCIAAVDYPAAYDYNCNVSITVSTF